MAEQHPTEGGPRQQRGGHEHRKRGKPASERGTERSCSLAQDHPADGQGGAADHASRRVGADRAHEREDEQRADQTKSPVHQRGERAGIDGAGEERDVGRQVDSDDQRCPRDHGADDRRRPDEPAPDPADQIDRVGRDDGAHAQLQQREETGDRGERPQRGRVVHGRMLRTSRIANGGVAAATPLLGSARWAGRGDGRDPWHTPRLPSPVGFSWSGR